MIVAEEKLDLDPALVDTVANMIRGVRCPWKTLLYIARTSKHEDIKSKNKRQIVFRLALQRYKA